MFYRHQVIDEITAGVAVGTAAHSIGEAHKIAQSTLIVTHHYIVVCT